MKFIKDLDLRLVRLELESLRRRVGSTAHHIRKKHYQDAPNVLAGDLMQLTQHISMVLDWLPKPKDRQ